jgi:hypothetical protein
VSSAPTTSSFSHIAFGLRIDSALELPQLLKSEADTPPDATIKFGPVSEHLPEAVASGVRFDSAPGKLLLRVDGVARYLITDGNRIVIERDPAAQDIDLRVFLLGSAFGALLHQRQDLVLHGSAIEWEGEAVVFMGVSGVGKSTTSTAFRKRGHPVLTDDLCVVRPGPDGRMLAYPGFPQSKLWLDSLEKLDFSPDSLIRIREKIEKRALPLGEDFCADPLPIKKLYLLRSHNEEEIKLVPSQGPGKFSVLKNNTYRFGYLAGIDGKTGHFQQALQLAQQAPVSIAIRPREGFKLDEFVAALEADLRT